MNSKMIKYIIISFIFLSLSLEVHSQKADLLITGTKKTGINEWQILDGQYRLVISGNDFARQDSVFFGLEAERRYLLQIYVPGIINKDS